MNATTKQEIAAQVHRTLKPLDIVPLDEELPGEPTIGRMRRNRRRGMDDDVGVVSLLELDGVLVWEEGAVSPATSRRRRYRGALAVEGEVVTRVKYSKALGRNSIVERLRLLDAQLTPRAKRVPDALSGSRLLEYDKFTLDLREQEGDAAPVKRGRILLLVHGTFSNTESVVRELRADPKAAFLKKTGAYDQILGFDHYTLSQTPVVNAVALARLLAESRAEIDVICHSRGGLVARWFSEVLDRVASRKRRVVFVGCPLRGTSLADPQSLRHGLDLMTNVGSVIGDAGSLVPFLSAASGLVGVLSSVGGFVANSPVIDAGVGLVPGLAAMSRIQNNAELDALNGGNRAAKADYFAVSSSFMAEAVGWKFWRLFNKLKVADAAADYLVFEQDNDLVVDTESMTYHAFGPDPQLDDETRFCRFDGASGIHHTTYFRDPKTVRFLVQSFGL